MSNEVVKVPERKKCKVCRTQYNEDESLGSEFDQCQDCWEAWCDSEWWKMFGGRL